MGFREGGREGGHRGNLIPNGGLIEMDGRFQKDSGQVKRQGHGTPAICNLQSENQSALARLAKGEGTGSGGSKCKQKED